MAKIKMPESVKDAKPYSKPPAIPIGVYRAKVASVEQRESRNGNDMLEVIVEIAKGQYKTRKMYHYVLLDADDEINVSRLREFLEATGVVKPGSKKVPKTWDPEDTVGSVLQVKTRIEKDLDGDDQARVARLLPLASDDDEDDGEGAPEPDDEDEDADAEAEADEDEDEDEGEDEDEVDLDELDRAALKDYIKQNSLEVRVKKTWSDDDIRKAIIAAETEGDEDEDEDEDEDDSPDYSSMSMQALKDLCSERGLPTSGKKSQLVAKLQKDDASDGDDPF